MVKKLLALILLASISCSSIITFYQVPLNAQNNPLSPYLWQNRLLLVFVPQISDPRLALIEKTVKSVECEFQDRDLLLGIFTTDASARIGAEEISAYDIATLRAKYAIKSNQFAVLLIGKDGQPKSKFDQVPKIENIFARIDNMSMRQQEMINRSESCI